MSDTGIEFFALPASDFPILAELLRDDTGEVVWRRVINGPGVIKVPGFGGQGFRVHARITYADGRVDEEEVPEKEWRLPRAP